MCYRAAGVAAWLTRSARVCHLGYPPEEGELEWAFRIEPHVIIACHDGQAREVAPDVRSLTRDTRLISVPNGIDVTRFTPPREGDSPAAWQPRKPVVAILGHLSEVKGYPTFLHAAAQIVAAGEDCAFVAVGKELAGHGYRAVLDRMVADFGLTSRVTFLGFRPDVETVLRAVDVVVLPSLAEGLPMALLEAMACARPIVASAVGGIPEAIEDRINGLLVPPNDPTVLAQAVLTLLRDRCLASRLGQQARADAVSKYSVNRTVAAIEATYEALSEPAGYRPHTITTGSL
jgi:glycosyltransferase involved in cell wall biosynthesis